MHYLVRLIVEGDNADEAIAEADSVMWDLVEWKECDWYTMRSQESSWPDCWKPVRLSSKTGQAWVADALQGQLTEFKEAMASIRFMCEQYSDEQIFDEKFEESEEHYLSRDQFSIASGYHANVCHLYGDCGNVITNQVSLDSYLENWQNYWVVQVDCHN